MLLTDCMMIGCCRLLCVQFWLVGLGGGMALDVDTLIEDDAKFSEPLPVGLGRVGLWRLGSDGYGGGGAISFVLGYGGGGAETGDEGLVLLL